MGLRAATGSLIELKLERERDEPLHRQLYLQLRDAILEGRLRPGLPLPSTRRLSAELRCSRTTVVCAFDQLLSEGYVLGRVGSGTKVAEWLPEELLGKGRAADPDYRPSSRLSPRGMRLAALLPRQRVRWPSFTPGEPDYSLFPVERWNKLAAKCWRSAPSYQFRNSDPAGFRPLREAIATYLAVARGLVCEADQVFVTNGTQHSIDLATRLIADPGDRVLLEDPCFPAWRKVAASGADPVPVPVDDEGLRIDLGEQAAPDARLAVVSPSRQYPLGMTMSLTRRLQLLDWAKRRDAWILEDDYDSEYRYAGPPLSALQALDQEGRVIYMGSFSKTLFTSFRVGYLIVPKHVVDDFRKARAVLDHHPPIYVQPLLAEFIDEGYLAAHIRKTRQIYAARQATLVDAVRSYGEGYLSAAPAEGGLHLIGWLHPELAARTTDVAASERAAGDNINAPPLSEYYAAGGGDPGLLLGYAALPEEEIRIGVKRLVRQLATL